MRQALIIVDMLNDFLLEGAPLRVPGAMEIVPNIKRRLAQAQGRGEAVIYLCDCHRPDDSEFQIWPVHAVEDTWGAEIVEQLKPGKESIIIKKTRYSGFYQTNLDTLLRNLGVGRMILTGVVTNICILYTAADAVMRGYEVVVPQDCVAALSDEDQRFALKQLREVLKVEVI